MTPAEEQAHMHRCLLRWICRASPAKREKFVATSKRVRGEAKTAELMDEAREMYVEMKSGVSCDGRNQREGVKSGRCCVKTGADRQGWRSGRKIA